ncbi:LuxR C-terminal-related transcriptional regulator [Paraburkholderia sp. FT54]|uniref:LuxR C-terminal-related transcriptional regulator n=1 Tax=Paraburkholderia sp. FT54 TaxID=3074437 RepID=UPI0028772BB2|nr:LuxR C-terminal-related transcriptional regulator [Paraburkholderia sp. FT54]WNC94823.1 LuxR C-terminal-related transcriptional regulator [Paraburkholderia sp. FT54]
MQIALHTGALLATGRIRMLMRWLDRIPDDALASHPRTGLTYAWVLLLNRRYADALKTVQRILANHESTTDRDNLAVEAEAVRCVLLALTDQIHECRETGLAILDRLPPDAIFAYCSLANSLVFSLVSTHRYDEARAVLSRALQRTQDHPFLLMRAVTETLEAIIDLVQGRLGTALARLETASGRNWSDLYGGLSGGKTSLDISLALVLYETNSLDEADRLVTGALPYAKGNSPPDALIVSHLVSARIAHVRGDTELWQRRLVELEQLGRDIGLPRLRCSAWLERARVATLEGRFDAAAQALRSAVLHGEWDNPDVSFHATDIDLPFIAQCRFDIARGEHARAAQALLTAMEQATVRLRHRRILKLRVLHAMALAGLGEKEQSYAELTEALHTASQEGFVRMFIDEGEKLGDLIGLWAAHYQGRFASLGIVPGFVERLLAQFTPKPLDIEELAIAQAAGMRDTANALTARELDVLRMLSAGHRNRIIAEKLFVSELTIKSHLRKINVKLGAQNRTQAVAIGRSRGLIQ